MTAGIDGDPGRAMAKSMTTLSVTMACLSPNPPMDGARVAEGVRELQTRRSGLEFG